MYQIKAKTIILSVLCCLALAGCSADAENLSSKDTVSQEASSSTESEAPSLPERQPEGETEQVPEKMSLEQAVVSAVLEENRGKYFPGEYQGAGCKIFETFEEGDKLAVYALIEYIEYGFEDGRFVNVSGTRARVLLDFQTGQDTYALTGYTVLDPTSGLSDAELEALMAPVKETGKEYLYTDSDFDELRGQVEAGTEEYLKSIGREGEVFERDSHDDGFISFLNDKAYNALTKDLEISNYPNWEGTLEKIEDGIRYVYQAHFDSESNQIEYTKTNYDTGETVEKITADAAMGERIP